MFVEKFYTKKSIIIIIIYILITCKTKLTFCGSTAIFIQKQNPLLNNYDFCSLCGSRGHAFGAMHQLLIAFESKNFVPCMLIISTIFVCQLIICVMQTNLFKYHFYALENLQREN